MLELTAADVHLVQRRRDPRGKHARTVSKHMETVLVSHDALVDAAPVALALVIRLRERARYTTVTKTSLCVLF